MAEWKVRIVRREEYKMDIVVEADNLDDAIVKATNEWDKDTYLYDHLSDCMTDARTDFYKLGIAGKKGEEYLIHI